MVAQKFAKSFSVNRPSSECWDVLIDVNRVSSWVSVVDDVVEYEHLAKYSAVLEDRLGPFKLRADLDISVTDMKEGSSISVRADGEDRQLGSRIQIEAVLAIDPNNSGCTVTIDGQYEVTGRVATMGASTIRQKAEKILDQFSGAAQQDLA